MTKTIASPVKRVGRRFVKVVSNKLIQDWWREEIKIRPQIKPFMTQSKAMNFINKYRKAD